MKVRYRANDDVRDVSDDAGRALIDAGICDVVEEQRPPSKARKQP